MNNLKYNNTENFKSHEWFIVRRLREEGDYINDMEETFNIMRSRGYKAVAWLLCNVPWFYVNLNDKLFFSGRIGIDMLSGRECIGKHAISFNEFLIIDDMFSKYEGHSVLDFKL